MWTPSDEELEEDVQSHLARIENFDAVSLRHGYGALLRMNLVLRRQLCEALAMAKIIYVGDGAAQADQGNHS